ncbi:HAD-IC family P-type ATPase [Candidatus Woesearchaeota archaeon]|nr:HAD-IC family P-type ATPase [Candidatus Woesearchaeota archaeon]
MQDWHRLKISELFEKLDSSPEGLSSAEAKKRSQQHGLNELEKRKKAPAIIRFLKHATNFFALLLWTGALLAFIAEYLAPGEGNLYIGVALGTVVLLNAVFSFYQESKAEQAMDAFKKMMPDQAKVLRDGAEVQLLAREIVPGDVFILEEGDKVPADARLFEANALKVDNSSLTGESEPQLRSIDFTHKNILESRNMAFSSTTVLTGSGKAVVYATGMDTQIGKVAGLTETIEAKHTPIHRELQFFIKVISIIAIILGVGFFGLGFFFERGFWQNMIFAIGIIVANVPEGLLPTVTLALSISSQKMARKNALIKNLESVETLGCTTVICTDKTGTITQNRMSVNSVLLGDSLVDTGAVHDKTDFDKLLHACVLCNNSNITRNDIGYDYVGDPMEGSLLVFAGEHIDIEKTRQAVTRTKEEPFDSLTKRMITVNSYRSGKAAYMKGAPEVVIKKCSHILIDGSAEKITKAHQRMLEEHSRSFSGRGERVLAFAYKKSRYGFSDSELESGYTFIGLLGMLDPPRPDVDTAVAKCKKAGIKIIMITGDHPLTAESIARKVGIISSEDPTIVSGDELSGMDNDRLKRILKEKEVLFARTSPQQKLKIVKALQEIGEIVAVTGDGVNDAPALKNADIGVAMGKCGTDVAKEAADMVLVDDNFSTIVNAVEEGRTIYENIKNFIVYILTSNVPEIIPFIVFVLFGLPLPLTVVLILAIDLGTDLIPALGLATEKLESDTMEQKPRSKDDRLLTKRMIFRSYCVVGMLEAAAGFTSYFFILYRGGWSWGQELAYNNPLYMKAVTGFFVAIIITQIANVMISRVRRQSVFKQGIFSNKIILLGIAVELALAGFISYSPVAHTYLHTASLSFFEFFMATPFALFIFFADELRRLIIRKSRKAKEYMEL